MTREERVLKYVGQYETPVILDAIVINVQPLDAQATKAAVDNLVSEGFLFKSTGGKFHI